MIWNQLLAGPDQMRKRMALALSEFFVVSLEPDRRLLSTVRDRRVLGRAHARNAFGNFRDAARAHHAQRRHGLLPQHQGQSQGRRQRPAARRELRARGDAALHHRPVRAQSGRHAQGSTPTDKPIETYGQSDITNLARVFTGYDWDYLSNGGTFTRRRLARLSDVPSTHFATNPMRFIADNHSNLGGELPRHDDPGEHAGPGGAATSRSTVFSTMPTPGRSSRGR